MKYINQMRYVSIVRAEISSNAISPFRTVSELTALGMTCIHVNNTHIIVYLVYSLCRTLKPPVCLSLDQMLC